MDVTSTATETRPGACADVRVVQQLRAPAPERSRARARALAARGLPSNDRARRPSKSPTTRLGALTHSPQARTHRPGEQGAHIPPHLGCSRPPLRGRWSPRQLQPSVQSRAAAGRSEPTRGGTLVLCAACAWMNARRRRRSAVISLATCSQLQMCHVHLRRGEPGTSHFSPTGPGPLRSYAPYVCHGTPTWPSTTLSLTVGPQPIGYYGG